MNRRSLITDGLRGPRKALVSDGYREVFWLHWFYNGQLVHAAILNGSRIKGWILGTGANGGQG